MDKLASDMKEVKARLAPILEKELDGIDLKSSTIFFASLVKEQDRALQVANNNRNAYYRQMFQNFNSSLGISSPTNC